MLPTEPSIPRRSTSEGTLPVAYLDAPEFDAFLQAETKRLSEVVKRIGRVEEKKP